MQTIDYSKYTYHELHEALNAVDQEQFPDNYQAIIKELEARKASGETDSFADKERSFFAGFWRRVFAHTVDCLLLALPIIILNFLLFDALVSLGNYGALIGFILSATYFSLGYSHVFSGQTPGKALMDITIIDQNAQHLSLRNAFIRYLILDFPYYLSALLLLWIRPGSLIGFSISLLALLVLLASIYLLIFNLPSRRAVHDYAVGSFVINLGPEPKAYKPFWKGHYYFLTPVLTLAVIFFVIGFINTQKLQQSLAPIKQSIESQTDYQVKLIDVNEVSHPTIKGVTLKTLVVNVHSFDATMDLETMSDEVTEIITNHPHAIYYNNIFLIASTGFNLGIAYSYKRELTSTQL